MGNFKLWMEQPQVPQLNLNNNIDPMLLQKIETYLNGIEKAGYRLLAHQTSNDIALKIIQGQSFGRGRGVHGTTIYQTASNLRKIIENMNMYHKTHASNVNNAEKFKVDNAMAGMIHRGSNSIVIMAIPNQSAGRYITDFEDNLASAMQSGLIPDLSVPNQYIVGFWQADGQFHANSRFNPKNGPLK